MTWVLPFVFLATALISSAVRADDDVVRLWSSTGGGWRAMFACMGYANAFEQAGLFRNGKSQFDAIAVNSGAAWFATQLFYSSAFYQKTVGVPPESLYDFSVAWMDSYLRLVQSYHTGGEQSLEDITNTSSIISAAEKDDEASDTATYLNEFYDLFIRFDGDWALFVQKMLDEASTDYGHGQDSGNRKFVDIEASDYNRISAMNTTDLLIQTAISPTARIRQDAPPNTTESSSTDDEIVYFGPVNTTDIYSVAVSAAYVVNDTYSGFQYATHDTGDSSNLAAHAGSTTSSEFSYEDWSSYYLWGAADVVSFVTQSLGIAENTISTLMSTPFQRRVGSGPPGDCGQIPPSGSGQGSQPMTPNGSGPDGCESPPNAGVQPPPETGEQQQSLPPQSSGVSGQQRPPPQGSGPPGGPPRSSATITQIAAISSAAVGTASPAIPSVYAQAWSKVSLSTESEESLVMRIALDQGVQNIYEEPILDNVAVCSQWPNKCGSIDGWFIDGGFADNPSFAINIAQYHQSHADINKPMKVVLTNTNEEFDSMYNLAQFLQYFSSDFNDGIAPGDYIWVPGTQIPRRSPQVFGEPLDASTLMAIQQPVDGSNMTSCVLVGTTIENPAFGIRAGQTVEVLLLNLNVPITTFVAGETIIKAMTVPLAEMAMHIASNAELVQRVQDFFYPDGIPDEGQVEGDIDVNTGEPADEGAAVDEPSDLETEPPEASEEEAADSQLSAASSLRAAFMRFTALTPAALLVF